MTTFESLGLADAILKALAAEGYVQPTPIQADAIPPVLVGHDVLGLAQTGTGKTCAFATPILHRLAADRRHAGARACRVLVLAPTRELAAQICDGFRAYGKFLGLSTTVVFGGVPIGRQIKALERGVDVLVATPGRLLDLVQQRALRLDAVETLVLDEADHMLDLGFIVPLRRIRGLVPKQRQTLLFSATMPDAIAKLAGEFLNDPVRVAVTPVASTPTRVAQSVIFAPGGAKQGVLHAILEDKAVSRALVFTRTKHGADRVVRRLESIGVEAHALHGNKSQGQRERALAAFKKGHARLLVATDIAARGIDVDLVTHVINFDLPDTPEAYVHRIGRTARAGAAGEAISLCAPDETGQLRAIERITGVKIAVAGRVSGEEAAALAASVPPDVKPAQQERERGGYGERGHGRNGPRGQGQPKRHGQDQRQDQRASGGPSGRKPHRAARPQPGESFDRSPRRDEPRGARSGGGDMWSNQHADEADRVARKRR